MEPCYPKLVSILRCSYISCAGEIRPTVIDKIQLIGSIGSRLRDQIYVAIEAVGLIYNCYIYLIFRVKLLNINIKLVE